MDYIRWPFVSFGWKIKKCFWFWFFITFGNVGVRDTQYNMLVCCTTPRTLGKNTWKIVFIWARTFLLPIKQPSSSNYAFASLSIQYIRPLLWTNLWSASFWKTQRLPNGSHLFPFSLLRRKGAGGSQNILGNAVEGYCGCRPRLVMGLLSLLKAPCIKIPPVPTTSPCFFFF